MRELALFAGCGGGILGGYLLGWETVCAVEIEDYPRRILLQRQRDGILQRFPIWDDICTFDGRPWRGRCDIVSGGFPCQDISLAGRGAGIEGDRSGLWSEMCRVIREIRPRFAFVENVPALTGRGLDRVLGDLADMGYDARWCVLGADDAGAPHHRKRIWILAHTKSDGRDTWWPECSGQERRTPPVGASNVADTAGTRCNDAREYGSGSPLLSSRSIKCGEDVADSSGKRLSEPTFAELGGFPEEDEPFEGSELGGANSTRRNYWSIEPAIRRVVNGFPNRVQRLKALGNAQVPAVAALAFVILSEGLI
jgi:DNA (cytosine-5)-methyltransferase 1